MIKEWGWVGWGGLKDGRGSGVRGGPRSFNRRLRKVELRRTRRGRRTGEGPGRNKGRRGWRMGRESGGERKF